MPDIAARESNLTIWYQIVLDGETRYIVGVSIISPDQGRDVLRGYSENYAMVIPFSPPGAPYPFLRGVRTQADYVAARLRCDTLAAGLYAAIMPELTSMAPPEDILAAAVKHQEDRKGGANQAQLL